MDVLSDYPQVCARLCLGVVLGVPFQQDDEMVCSDGLGSNRVSLYTQGMWGLKSVLALSNIPACMCTSLVTSQYTQRYMIEFTSGLRDILRSMMEETVIP